MCALSPQSPHFLSYLLEESGRLSQLQGNCGRTIRRFLDQAFTDDRLLLVFRTESNFEFPLYPLSYAAAAINLQRTIAEIDQTFGSTELLPIEGISIASADKSLCRIEVEIKLSERPTTVKASQTLLQKLHVVLSLFAREPIFVEYTDVQQAITEVLDSEVPKTLSQAESLHQRFCKVLAGDAAAAGGLPGPFLTAIEVMDPVLYSKIDAIFEAEYQAELEAEARMR